MALWRISRLSLTPSGASVSSCAYTRRWVWPTATYNVRGQAPSFHIGVFCGESAAFCPIRGQAPLLYGQGVRPLCCTGAAAEHQHRGAAGDRSRHIEREASRELGRTKERGRRLRLKGSEARVATKSDSADLDRKCRATDSSGAPLGSRIGEAECGCASSARTRKDAIGVVDGLDVADRVEHRLEVLRVSELEHETHVRHSIGPCSSFDRHHVDLVARHHA